MEDTQLLPALLLRHHAKMTAMDAIYDHAGSMRRMGEDEQLFSTMVAYLHHEGARRLAEIRERLDRGDLAGVERAAHVLKGQISNFGAPRAWNAAACVESAVLHRDVERLAAQIEELADALAELLVALEPWMPADEVRS